MRRGASPMRRPLLGADAPSDGVSRGGTRNTALALIIFFAALAIIVIGSLLLALLLPRQSDTEASLRTLTACLEDGSCVGGDLHLETLVVDGNVTAPNIPNGTCVQTLNGVVPNNETQFNIDLVGGDNVIVTPDPTQHAVNISLSADLNITMLAVQGDTLLGLQTTCGSPLLPSCLDISNQSCTAPLAASCLPANATYDTLHVNTIVLANGQNVTTSCNLGDSLTVGTLTVDDLVLTGTFACPNPSTGIPQNCLNLNGYTCPLGQPLADSCIPASLTFTNMSVTNTLSVNMMTCAQPLDASTCLNVLGGDVTGAPNANTVTALQGVPIDTTTPLTQAVFTYNGLKWTGNSMTWSEPSVGNTVVARDSSGNITVGVLNAELIQPFDSNTCLGLGAPGSAVGACAKADMSMDYHSITNVNAIYLDNLYASGVQALSNPVITIHSDLSLDGNTLWFNNATNFYSSTPGILQTDAALVLSATLTAARYTAYSPLGVPTVAAGAGAGTGPTLTVTAGSNDCKMQVVLTTGTGPAVDTLFTITYRTAATGTLTSGVVFSAAGANAAALTGTSAPWVSAEALDTFTFRSGSVALAATTTYTWNFQTCA